jgi:RNA polymerase sigma factor (sigma-70 family)
LVQANLDLPALVAALLAGRLPPHVDIREDLEAEGRLQLFEAVKEFDCSVGVPFRAWAKRFLLWRVMEQLRRRKLRDAMHSQIPDEYDRAEASTLESDIARAELGGHVRAFVERLPNADRNLLKEHYLAGVSITEIGRRVGVSQSRVSQRHMALLKRLRTNATLRRLDEAA